MAEAHDTEPDDAYVLALGLAGDGADDGGAGSGGTEGDSGHAGGLTALRGRAVADALARGPGRRAAPAADAAAVESLARWAIERLDAAGLVYERAGGAGWWLRCGALHAESERRLDELDGWSDAAVAGQRRLLAHVDDPGDTGSELEQSLSKLAASGWKVDAKKDKGQPEVFYAAGDLPLADGSDWRAPAVHPRLADALAPFVALAAGDSRGARAGEGGAEDVPAGESRAEGAPAGEGAPPTAGVAERLPALAVVAAGEAGDVALLDVRTVAKALRDCGALDLPSGEPLAPVVAIGAVRLRANPRGVGGGATTVAVQPSDALDPVAAGNATAKPSDADASEADAANAAGPDGGDPNDVEALVAAHGEDAVRFALLHAAAPEKRFRGGEDVVGYAAAFLAELRELAATWIPVESAAEPLPGAPQLDTSDGLRRRLAGWCETAAVRSVQNYERLQPHRATRNAVELLARIRVFEARVAEQRGEIDGADREAVAHALALLARLLRPLAPATAADLAGDEHAIASAR